MFQEAICIKMKAIHVIYSSPVVDKLFFIAKPFLKKSLLEIVSNLLFNKLQTQEVCTIWIETFNLIRLFLKTSQEVSFKNKVFRSQYLNLTIIGLSILK